MKTEAGEKRSVDVAIIGAGTAGMAAYRAVRRENKTALLNNARDSLCMAMFRAGVTDVNTGDPAIIDQAKSDVAEVVKATNARFDHSDYTDVPNGKTWLHQSWSGNVGSAFYFLPEGDTAPNISYYWPASTEGVPGNVDNDTIVLLKGSKAPVLAHLFIDFMLDAQNALANRADSPYGYGVVDGSAVPDRFVETLRLPDGACEVVLATDGYPQPLPTLAASELALEAILRDDPHMIRLHVSTKGVAPGHLSFDDRTYARVVVPAGQAGSEVRAIAS